MPLESKLIRSELTIRELAFPEETKLARKSLIRWVALSLGLMSPNESRQLLLDILEVLFYFHAKKESPTTVQIIDKLNEMGGKKMNPKTVYYHLLRLKELGVISRKKGVYFFGNRDGKKLAEIFKEFYITRTNEIFKNIEESLLRLEDTYNL